MNKSRKPHKQKYFKKENKKINKNKLKEIVGTRVELAPFVEQTLEVECFVTNTIGYQGEKRLVTEVKIPGTDYFIKHVWFKYENIGKLKHGYQKLKVKVTKYKDYINNQEKYGLKYMGKKGKVFIDTKIRKPKWMKDD